MEKRFARILPETFVVGESSIPNRGKITRRHMSHIRHLIQDKSTTNAFVPGFDEAVAEARELINLMKNEVQRTRAEDQKWMHLKRENDDLRQLLQRQGLITDAVRREGEESLREMRKLSQRSDTLCGRQLQLEETVGMLQKEARDTRGQFASLKTRKVGALAWSDRPPVYPDSIRHFWEELRVKEDGTAETAMRLYTAVDSLLWAARTGGPEKLIEEMPSIVTSVGQITRALEEPWSLGHATVEVSKTLSALLVEAQNVASGLGLTPLSLLDAAAFRLTAAVMMLLGTTNITLGQWESGGLETRSTRSSQPLSLQAGSTEWYHSNSESSSLYSPATPFEHMADQGTWILEHQSP